MTIRHLQIFSEVCRMESITKAADNMNIAQPEVSSAIRELESFPTVQVENFQKSTIPTVSGLYSMRKYSR